MCDLTRMWNLEFSTKLKAVGKTIWSSNSQCKLSWVHMGKISSDHEVLPDNTQRWQQMFNIYLSSFASCKYMLHMPDHKI